MADQRFPHAPAPSSAHSPQFTISSKRSRTGLAALAVLAIAALIAVASGAFGGPEDDARITLNEREHTIQVDVLNAAGTTRLAQKLTDYLRSKGFDVVETGNLKEPLEKTLVIDRAGNSEAALRVAEAIGIPSEQVMQKIDRNLYLDVSVFIGKDYQTLKPFR